MLGIIPLVRYNPRVDGFQRLEATIVSLYLQQAFSTALLVVIVLLMVIYYKRNNSLSP